MLGAIFVVSGARAMAKPEYHVPQAKQVTDWITPVLEKASPSLPTDTRTLIRINGAVQFAGGLLLVGSRARRAAAAALAASMVPTTLAGHPFWDQQEPEQRRAHQVHFLKNLGLVGGLLIAALDNEGRPGLAWRGEHLVQDTRDSAMRQLKMARRQARMAGRVARRQRMIGRRAAHVGHFVGSIKGRLPG
jgi:putative oxidoreductase